MEPRSRQALAPKEALAHKGTERLPVGGQLPRCPVRRIERFLVRYEDAKTGSFELTGFFAWTRLLAKHRDDVLDGNHVKLVVGFKVHGNGVFGVEDDLVVLA